MLRRRDVSLVGLGLMAASADAQSRRTGRLVVIGGAEDRLYDKVILRRFTELCGGPGSRIRVLSAASGNPERAWDNYQKAFGELGVTDCAPIPIPDRAAADTSTVTDLILEADGIFISGGDQRRLMDLLWETDAFRALHVAFHLRGCCIGGTSAGAAALSRHMLVRGEESLRTVTIVEGWNWRQVRQALAKAEKEKEEDIAKVLANPGTPSNNKCPLDNSPISNLSVICR